MSVKKNRVDLLESVARDSGNKYINSQLNKTFHVLTEEIEGNYVVGYTENYLKVMLPKDTPLNKIVKARLFEYNNNTLKAEVLEVE